MDSNKAYEVFLSWQTTVMCVALFGMVFAIRRFVETLWGTVKTKKWWTDAILAVLPMALGVAVCLAAKEFPYPAGIKVTSVRVLYGIFCGLASGWAYARLKTFFLKDVKEDAATPVPVTKPADPPLVDVPPTP
jgi:uncharacterized membrane protein YeiB